MLSNFCMYTKAKIWNGFVVNEGPASLFQYL